MCRSAAMSTRPVTAARTMAASTGCGRFRNSPDAKSATISMKRAAISPDSGVRAPALSLTSDCDMPPLTGNPRPSPAARFAAPIARISAVGIEPIAVLLGEHSADGRRLHGRKDEARERQRHELVEVAPADERQPQRRQAAWHVRPAARRPAPRDSAVAPRQCHRSTTRKATGRFFIQSLPARSTASAATPSEQPTSDACHSRAR